VVWRDLDQKQLDDGYSQMTRAPNMKRVIARWDTNSELTRLRIGHPVRHHYGNSASERLDLFETASSSAPIHVFVHGGAWQQGSAANYAFIAETIVSRGVHCVIPDFSWVQQAGRSLFPIVEQLRDAISWIHRNARSFGGDPDRIYVSGHSSGAHLVGVLLTTDWHRQYKLPPDLIKGGLCCSGMFDLEPVRKSHRGGYIDFTDEMEDELSPIRHLDKLSAPVVVAHGSEEAFEFVRQSREFADGIANAGGEVELIVAEGYNHFEVIETLGNPFGVLGHAALRQMSAARFAGPTLL
jgi:arylformamidase